MSKCRLATRLLLCCPTTLSPTTRVVSGPGVSGPLSYERCKQKEGKISGTGPPALRPPRPRNGLSANVGVVDRELLGRTFRRPSGLNAVKGHGRRSRSTQRPLTHNLSHSRKTYTLPTCRHPRTSVRHCLSYHRWRFYSVEPENSQETGNPGRLRGRLPIHRCGPGGEVVSARPTTRRITLGGSLDGLTPEGCSGSGRGETSC